MDHEEQRKKEMIEIWVRAWNNKLLGSDYSEARKFREYWIEECPGLRIEKALLKFKEKKC